MKGIVVQFRRGRRTIHERHFLLDFGETDKAGAGKLLGKSVVWTSPAGKKIAGLQDIQGKANAGLGC